MAGSTSAARRYAEATFQLATRDDSFDVWAADLAVSAQLIGDPRVAHLVNNPSLPLVARQALLGRLLADHVTPLTLNLVRLLDQRGRLRLLTAIAGEYTRLLDAKRGIVAATVTSAAPLDAEETAAIKAQVESMTGSTVKLASAVDPDLIGGLTVQVGDRKIDASVRGRLERLRDQLVAGSR